MVEKIRKTQEEEILEILEREGFEEVPEADLKKEPYKSYFSWPECVTQEEDKEKISGE